MADSKITNSKIQRKLYAMIVVLSLQFLLGMFLNLWGVEPEAGEHSRPLISSIIFMLHGIIGLLLLGGSIHTFITTLGQGKPLWKKITAVEMVSVIVAVTGGVIAVVAKEQLSEIGSYIMSIGFLLAFIAYGWHLLILRSE